MYPGTFKSWHEPEHAPKGRGEGEVFRSTSCKEGADELRDVFWGNETTHVVASVVTQVGF